MTNSQAKFVTGNLFKHVATMSFTGSIGLLAIFAVDFVDLIFISMLGNSALAAAVGYAGTLLFFSSSISIGLSIAAGVIIARDLGKGDDEHARKSATHISIIGFILACFLAAIFWILAPAIVELLGAKGETLDLAVGYVRILLPTMPIMMLAMIFNALLRSYGDAKFAMYATLGGGVVNAILDPILIFSLNLGLSGAAIASVFARFTMFAVAIWPLLKTHKAFAKSNLTSAFAQAGEIQSIATPSILANISTPIGSAFVMRAMAEFGDGAVAAISIINRLIPVAFSVVFSLSGAIGPIIGQNAGAGRMDRVDRAYKDALIFTAIYVTIVSALLYFGRGLISAQFQATPEQQALLYLFCGPLSLSYIFIGAVFVSNASFNNLGHPYYSTWINWGRNTLGTIVPIMALTPIMGASGVLVGQAVGAVVFAALGAWLVRRVTLSPNLENRHGFLEHARAQIISWRRH